MERHGRPDSRHAAAALQAGLIRHLIQDEGAPPTPAILEQLQEGVRVFEIEYRAFLNAQGQRPPLLLQAVLRVAFTELGQVSTGSDARFHFEALEARYRAAERFLRQRLRNAERGSPARSQPSYR